MWRQELVRLIREAGREPVELDTLYRPITRTETSVTVAVRKIQSCPAQSLRLRESH
jgi:hypothetical protein